MVAKERAKAPKRKDNFASADAHAPSGGPDAAAFFDFDKTLLHGDAGVIFGRTLGAWAYEQGLRYATRPRRLLWHVWVTVRIAGVLAMELFFRALYHMRIIKRSTLVRRGYSFLKGFPSAEMAERMDLVWERTLSKRLYPAMHAILDRHRKLGQRVVIVTTGLRPIVELSKRYLGGDVEVIACEMEVTDDGRWTGRVQGPLYGAHKAEALRAYAEKHGIDLAASYAYSDHWSDVAFLDAVGHPVAVNPRRKLRRLAALRGWKVLDLPKPLHAKA